MSHPNIASLVAFTQLDGNAAVGFMLPLFTIEGQQWFVQEVDDTTGLVRSFCLSDAPGEVTGVVEQLSVRIGGRPVHVFLDANGVHVGTLSKLAPLLGEFARNHPQHAGIALQIAEMIGTRQERQFARARVEDAIAQSSGMAASRIFAKTALESAFITKVQRALHLEQGSERLSTISRKFTIAFNSQGELEAANVELQDDHKRVAVAAILSELGTEFSSKPTTQLLVFAEATLRAEATVRAEATITQEDNFARPFYVRSRQEERIALALKAILEEPERVIEHIEQWSPTAGFEVRARGLVREAFRPSGGTLMSLPRGYEPQIALLIPQFWAACHPYNRGHLIYYLSLHLGRYPAVRQEIKRRLGSSHSAALERFRVAIETNISCNPD